MRDIESEIEALATIEALSIDQVFSEIKLAVSLLLEDPRFPLDHSGQTVPPGSNVIVSHARARQSLVITVAGTNGKGSVIHGVEAVLKETKFSYAKFTSPHIYRFNERIVVDGNEVEGDVMLSHLDIIKPVLQQFKLNYYQITFLLALSIFKHHAPHIILFEVGLGGLYDAVNTVDPDIAVITSIDYDHMAVLGDTLDKIAIQKLGIARSDKPLIVCQENPPTAILNQSISNDMRLNGRDFNYPCYLPKPLMRQDNAAGVIEVLKLISAHFTVQLPYDAIIPAYQVPFRCQHVKANCDVVFDVAHNPASVKNLSEHLQTNQSHGKTLAVFQAREDKDINGMVSAIDHAVDTWFVEKNIEMSAAVAKIRRCESIENAFLTALSTAQPEDRLVCFGSFVTISELAALLEEKMND